MPACYLAKCAHLRSEACNFRAARSICGAMQGLYSRLFVYRSRADRQPLEDFLTEVLADILTRMPRNSVIDLLEWCFRDARRGLDWKCLSGSALRWDTQVAIAGGIADLVLYCDGRPTLVIENKTWSGFRDHGTPGRPANQMTTYCEWLCGAAGKSPCGALLVTGTSEAPEGYHEEGDYAVEARAQVTWASLGRWFSSRLVETQERETWRDLAAELVDFIRERSLSSEIFTQADLAALTLALPAMDRWEATFTSMWSSCEDIRRRFLNNPVTKLQFNVEAGMYWHWRFGQPKIVPERAWVGLGLRLPEISQWFCHLDLPSSPHFVLILGSDLGALTHRGQLPPDWRSDEEDGQYMLGYPIHELPADPGKRIDALGQWMRGALTDARTILTAAKLRKS